MLSGPCSLRDIKCIPVIQDPIRKYETVEITDVDTCGNAELMQRIQAYASA